MDVACGKCGAGLRLNPNLAGTTVSCPRCGAPIAVPRAAREAPRRLEEADRPRTPRRFGATYTLWLLGAQAALAVLGLSCLVGVFRPSADRPAWSYLSEDKYALAGAGALLLLAVWAAYHFPVLTTLATALLAIGVCALRYVDAAAVDVTRTAALVVAMLALWLALNHRRAAAR
ncbi:MAG TPA: hypothetical protein VFY93_08090 [Planctomycetota bacterium]|nr:hypothetical protein [Planctomycetota bacterium]